MSTATLLATTSIAALATAAVSAGRDVGPPAAATALTIYSTRSSPAPFRPSCIERPDAAPSRVTR